MKQHNSGSQSLNEAVVDKKFLSTFDHCNYEHCWKTPHQKTSIRNNKLSLSKIQTQRIISIQDCSKKMWNYSYAKLKCSILQDECNKNKGLMYYLVKILHSDNAYSLQIKYHLYVNGCIKRKCTVHIN